MLITFLAMIFEVVFLGEQMISFDDLYVGFGDHWLCNRCSILSALPGAFGKLQLLLILWTWVDFEPWRHFPVLVLDEGLQGQGGRSKVVDQEIGNPMEWKIYQFEYINFILLISPGWWVEPWGNYLLWNMRQRDGAAFDLQTSHPSDLDQPCIVKRWRKHKPQHQKWKEGELMMFLPSMLASRRTSINVRQGSGFFHCANLKTFRRRSLLSLRLLFLLRLILRAVNIQSKVKMQIGLFLTSMDMLLGGILIWMWTWENLASLLLGAGWDWSNESRSTLNVVDGQSGNHMMSLIIETLIYLRW